ncbi:MAG: AMP-binding protein [Solirubrobacterales bacterium]
MPPWPGEEAPRIPAPANRWLQAAAERSPDQLALRDHHGEELSYRELLDRAEVVAATIASGARRSGAHCLVELEPGIDHAVALHGAILAGAVVQSLRPRLPVAEREAMVGSWPEVVIDDDWLSSAQKLPFRAFPVGKRDLEEPLTRTLTSGTSGRPRAVVHTAANHYWSATASALNLARRDDDRWLCCLPVDHIAGLAILLRSVIYRTTALVHPGFEVERVAAAITDEEATVISLVPTQLGRLLEAGTSLERLRAILCGGAPVPAAMLARARDRGAKVIQTYGTTETCSQICALSPEEATSRLGAAGRPLAGSRIEIADGEILASGPTIAADSIAADGMLHTGDRGRVDSDGCLWVEGRIDDLIVSGGENVMPEEVEAALLSHPAVSEAGVVGRSDPEWGKAVVAVVVAAAGAVPAAAELIEHCRRSLAPFKVPKAIELVAELPRTRSGKLIRRSLVTDEPGSGRSSVDL